MSGAERLAVQYATAHGLMADHSLRVPLDVRLVICYAARRWMAMVRSSWYARRRTLFDVRRQAICQHERRRQHGGMAYYGVGPAILYGAGD
jgi:hypothetical protein